MKNITQLMRQQVEAVLKSMPLESTLEACKKQIHARIRGSKKINVKVLDTIISNYFKG